MTSLSDFLPQSLIGHRLASGAKPSIGPGRRVYAIGDVHGCADLLDLMLDAINSEDDADGRIEKQIILLGDYVDRGPDTPGVLDRLIGLRHRYPNTVFLLGNHEAYLLEFIKDPASRVSWLEWGGEETLRNYGIDISGAREISDLARDLQNTMPADHLEFLTTLSLHHEIGDYVFVHAGFRPGVPLHEQTREDQLWIRGDFHHTPEGQRFDKVVVHGHQSAKKIVDKGWRICVDTGAVWNGTLTAVILEGTEKRFLSVQRSSS